MTITGKQKWINYIQGTKEELRVNKILTAKAEAFLEFLDVITGGLGDNPKVSLVDLCISSCEELEYHAQNAQDEAIELSLDNDDYDFDYKAGIGAL